MNRIDARLLLFLFAVHPLLAQTTLNLSQDLIRLGIASTNMVPNQPDVDAGPMLAAGVSYAQKKHIPVLTADIGAYYFLSLMVPDAHVALAQISNLTIDFQGSDLYFTHPVADGIDLYSSTNVVLQNFTLDYQPLPFTQVQVVSVDGAHQQIQFTVPTGWSNPSSFNTYLNAGWAGKIQIQFFRDGQLAPDLDWFSAQVPFSGNAFTITGNGSSSATPDVLTRIRPGDIAVIAMRQAGSPLGVYTCTGCTVRNVTAYSSIGDGVNVAYVQSTLLERVNTIPRPGTDRLVSTYGQGFTPSGPNNEVRLSRAIRTMDDGFSFDLWVAGLVQSQTNSRTLVVSGSYATTLSQDVTIPNGFPVSFERPSDGTILGNAIIVSQTTPPFTPPNYQVTFTFDRDLPANLAGAAMYTTDPNLRGANTLLDRNAIEDGAHTRGYSLWGYMNSAMSGNYIWRSNLAGVFGTHRLIPTDWQVPPLVNFTIANNVIDTTDTLIDADTDSLESLAGIQISASQTNGQPMSVSPHQNVAITNNFVADPGRSGIWLGNTTNGSVSGNYLLNPNNHPVLATAYFQYQAQSLMPVVIDTSVNIANGNNTIDSTSGRMYVTDLQYNELAAYAPGSVYRLNAYSLGTLANPGITLTDADGNTSPLTIKNTATHALDVQIPSATALGGAYVTLTSGGAKYFATLFIDSQDNLPALNGCTYELSPSSTSVAAGMSSLPILVVTQAGCAYQVLAADPFVSQGSSVMGTGVISVGLAANAGTPRTTTIEIAGQPITLTQAGILPTIQAVYDVWNYTTGVAPGAWVALSGTALSAGAPQSWDVTGAQLPTAVNGVSVFFNGLPATLQYVSSTQINALVPAGLSSGPVQVVVESNGTSGSPFSMTATATLPAVYAVPSSDGSAFFVTAALEGTAVLVGNSAVDSRVVRAALPGDILDLYTIGLGATADPSKFITNQVFAGAYPITASATVTIGGETAPVLFAGLTSPGLYLLRIAVPSDLPSGQSPLVVSAGASTTRSSLFLTLGAAPQ